MNRREFSRLSVLSLAATQLPRVGDAQAAPPNGKKMGFAVIGLGSIANAFLTQIASSSSVECVAFVTGHPDTKGPEWKQKFNLPNVKVYTYETMDQMKDNAAIEAVYVATPNALHKEHVVRSAKAGKHVLCEKPMAVSSAECRTMIDACKAAQVKLMIAYRMMYEPVYLKGKEILESGRLGPLKLVEGAFGMNIQPNVWRLNKSLAGGGPIFDVGVYPLNATRFLLGENPVSFTAQMSTVDTKSGRFKEMEESTTWTMKFPSGVMGSYSTTYGGAMPGLLRIHGETGYLDFVNAFGNGDNQLKGRIGKEEVDEVSPYRGQQYQLRLEAEALAENVWKHTPARADGEVGYQDLLAFEAIYKAAAPR